MHYVCCGFILLEVELIELYCEYVEEYLYCNAELCSGVMASGFQILLQVKRKAQQQMRQSDEGNQGGWVCCICFGTA